MKIEELASKLYQNVDSLDDIESDDVAGYLLEHYYLIPIEGMKCYEGEIYNNYNHIFDKQYFSLNRKFMEAGGGQNEIVELSDLLARNIGKHARIFIEVEKCE